MANNDRDVESAASNTEQGQAGEVEVKVKEKERLSPKLPKALASLGARSR